MQKQQQKTRSYKKIQKNTNKHNTSQQIRTNEETKEEEKKNTTTTYIKNKHQTIFDYNKYISIIFIYIFMHLSYFQYFSMQIAINLYKLL